MNWKIPAEAWKSIWLLVVGVVLFRLSGHVDSLERNFGLGSLWAGVLILVLLIAGLPMAVIALYRLGRLRWS